VLNVNELAGGLRPVALPGEERTVKIVQKGSNPHQGVGYAEDGTMVVVENGAPHVGKVVKIAVARMHQTVAGKMIFGEIIRPSRTGAAPASRPAFKKPSLPRSPRSRRV
jgi:uncharacterized protein YacL